MSSTPDTAPRPALVLIVDDEPDNRELLAIILGRDGFLLDTATCGEGALAAVARQPPDVILLDLMMPDMSGYEVAARLKGDPATRGIPIIMVTAMNDRATRVRALGAGVDDVISKPLDCAEICAQVRRQLRPLA